MTDDTADAAAAAARKQRIDGLEHTAYGRTASPEEAARALEAQRLLAEERERVEHERERVEQGRADRHDDAGSHEHAPADRRSPWHVVAVAAAVVAVVVVVGLLAGRGLGPADETASPSTREPTAEPEIPAAAPGYMDEVARTIGSAPESVELTAEEALAKIAERNEQEWQSVLLRFPDAQRPDVSLVRQISDDEMVQVVGECLASHGIEVDYAIGGNGIGYSAPEGRELETALGAYTCHVQYPTRAVAGLSPAQLGYVYDYFVQFKAPCLEALGYPIPDPPTREVFVATWPNQGWNPAPADFGSNPEFEAIEAACPSYPEGIS